VLDELVEVDRLVDRRQLVVEQARVAAGQQLLDLRAHQRPALEQEAQQCARLLDAFLRVLGRRRVEAQHVAQRLAHAAAG